MKDEHIQQLHSLLATSQTTFKGRHWRRYPLQCYRQIFHQLLLLNDIVYCTHSPGPTSDIATVPVIPSALCQQVLQKNHDIPSSGHLGADKTLSRLQNEAYWAGMSVDVEKYCRECIVCQRCKLSMPQKAPMSSVPIGKPWEIVTFDVLQVPISYQNNRYLLVVQDYFTK